MINPIEAGRRLRRDGLARAWEVPGAARFGKVRRGEAAAATAAGQLTVFDCVSDSVAARDPAAA